MFAGRFDLDGAKALGATGANGSDVEAVRHLIDLADRSLVTVESEGGAVSYRLLESVRLFAAARLDDRAATEAAHLAHYRTEATARETSLWGTDFEAGFGGFADNWDNYRASISFALDDGSPERLGEAMELLVATTLYAELAQRFEHADWAASVLDAAGDDHPGAAPARAGLARMRAWQSRLDEAVTLLHEAPFTPDHLGLGLASFWVAAMNSDHDRALEVYADLDTATRGTGGLYELVVASIYNRLATNAGLEQGDSSERIRAIARTAGPIAEAFALHADVHEALQAGDHERAVPLCEELIKFADSCGLTVPRPRCPDEPGAGDAAHRRPRPRWPGAPGEVWRATGVAASGSPSRSTERSQPVLSPTSGTWMRQPSSSAVAASSAIALMAQRSPTRSPTSCKLRSANGSKRCSSGGARLGAPELCDLAITELDAVLDKPVGGR